LKTLYKILFLFFTLQGILFAQWFTQTSGTIYALKSVHFINENTGFACCFNAVIKTTNGGLSWQSSFLQGNHSCVVFTDINTGYICSDSGKIFKTINAGVNWLPQNSNTANNLTSISFLNSQTGIISGYGKTLLKTTDGGTNWLNTANLPEQIDFLDIKIINQNIFYASGNESYIIKSINSGSNWQATTQGMPNPFFAIEFINENTGWATGCCGMFMSTTNGGQNWSQEYYLTLGFTLHSLKFINSLTGYTVGDNGGIYRTTNGGLWWDSTVTNISQTLYSIYMVNQNTGWVVGGYGTIFKTTNGGGPGYTIGVNQISSEIPSGFELYQNYPNPFNPETKIKFQIPLLGGVPEGQGGFTKLSVFDITGKEITTLINQSLNPGTYEVNFNASQYTSGVYYYHFISGNYTSTKKMVLIK
jgi:photosystem II stability/assembly factor-like uncharacterized protein